ncbi:MAG TPA: thioredoxin family protein [Thermoanaerobaculia bacterium]
MRLAHQFAIENDFITADMVEVSEFPQLVEKYQVSGVPKTIINDISAVVGHVPEETLLDAILQV